MGVNISDLIKFVGDDNVKIQSLDTCLIKSDWDHRKGSKITFGTEVKTGIDQIEEFGMVVWFKREDIKKALEQINP